MTDILTLISQALPLLLLVAIPVGIVRWLASDEAIDRPRLPGDPGWPHGIQEPEPEPWRFAATAGARREPPAGLPVRASDRRPLVAQSAGSHH